MERHRRETSQATTPINPRHVHIHGALNQEAAAAEMSLTQSHRHLAAVFIESYPIYTCGLDSYNGKKSNNDTVFGGGKEGAVDGAKREGAGNEGKERWSFDSFTSHSRHAWLICLLFFLFFTPIPLCWRYVALLLIPTRFTVPLNHLLFHPKETFRVWEEDKQWNLLNRILV